MVMNRNGETLFGMVLADHVIVEDLAYLPRRRDAVGRLHQRGLVLLADDVHGPLDALLADEDRRSGNELTHLVLAPPAELAGNPALGGPDLSHRLALTHIGELHGARSRSC